MKKLISIVVLLLAIVVVSGCSTFSDPSFAGNMAGKAAYATYQKVAADKSHEFKNRVSNIWEQVNKIDSMSELVLSCSLIILRFDDAIDYSGLSDYERLMLRSIRNDIVKKINQIIQDQTISDSEGIKFLVGMRNGINEMIEYNKGH